MYLYRIWLAKTLGDINQRSLDLLNQHVLGISGKFEFKFTFNFDTNDLLLFGPKQHHQYQNSNVWGKQHPFRLREGGIIFLKREDALFEAKLRFIYRPYDEEDRAVIKTLEIFARRLALKIEIQFPKN